MANDKPIGTALLWKTEDWLAVWVGFLIIIGVLAGPPISMPKFTWATRGEFEAYTAEQSPAVEKLAVSAGEKKEAAVGAAAAGLHAAIAAGDRKSVEAAAKKLEGAAESAQDKGVRNKAEKLGKEIRDNAGAVLPKVFSGENIGSAIVIAVVYLILSVASLTLMGEKAGRIIAGFPAVFALAWIGQLIAGNYTINSAFGIEYVLWCLFIGLFISNVIGMPNWLRPAVRTEFYIKSGLVILGANILIGEIMQVGFYGLGQAVLVVSAVWFFTYRVARKMDVDDDFAAVLSSAVSICGVSAAIATGGAIKADGKKISYATSIVLICAIPMMILQPLAAKWFSMSDAVAGAWLGGTLDTSGSVVAAGALISEAAMKTGVIVKMSQNVLIGVAAFALSVVWTLKSVKTSGNQQAPSATEMWDRFPKFVLGFIVASVLFSFFVSPETVADTKGVLSGLRTWWFALAFTCIGLETNFGDLARMKGGRPAAAFLVGQGFNIIWTLLLAWLFFGGVLFAVPNI